MENKKNTETTYVYFDLGEGYSKDRGCEYVYDTDKVKVTISSDLLEGCKELRIDPIAHPAVIRLVRLEYETAACFKKITPEEIATNGRVLTQGMIVYTCDEPQIIVPLPEQEELLSLCFEIEIISSEIESLLPVFAAYEQANIQLAKQYEEKYLALLSGDRSELKIASGQEQLMRDKLAYIQSTTIYRKLLKSKVDSLGLWNSLDI